MQEINNISDYPLSPTDAALEGFSKRLDFT